MQNPTLEADFISDFFHFFLIGGNDWGKQNFEKIALKKNSIYCEIF